MRSLSNLMIPLKKVMVSVAGLGVLLCLACSAVEVEERIVAIRITTELGIIEAELYPDRAPITVTNFVANIKAGLYKDGHFYRALVRQSGPNGPLSLIQGGKSMARVARPPIENETTAVTGQSHTDGVLSMARLEPGTASSEFFICIGDNTGLDYSETDAEKPGYAAFGRVTKGMEIVRRILSKPAGNRDPDDPILNHVREAGAGKLIPTLLNSSIPMHIELVNVTDSETPQKK